MNNQIPPRGRLGRYPSMFGGGDFDNYKGGGDYSDCTPCYCICPRNTNNLDFYERDISCKGCITYGMNYPYIELSKNNLIIPWEYGNLIKNESVNLLKFKKFILKSENSSLKELLEIKEKKNLQIFEELQKSCYPKVLGEVYPLYVNFIEQSDSTNIYKKWKSLRI